MKPAPQPDDDEEGIDPPTPAEVADYVWPIATELRDRCLLAGLVPLAHVLEMAAFEATQILVEARSRGETVRTSSPPRERQR